MTPDAKMTGRTRVTQCNCSLQRGSRSDPLPSLSRSLAIRMHRLHGNHSAPMAVASCPKPSNFPAERTRPISGTLGRQSRLDDASRDILSIDGQSARQRKAGSGGTGRSEHSTDTTTWLERAASELCAGAHTAQARARERAVHRPVVSKAVLRHIEAWCDIDPLDRPV